MCMWVSTPLISLTEDINHYHLNDFLIGTHFHKSSLCWDVWYRHVSMLFCGCVYTFYFDTVVVNILVIMRTLWLILITSKYCFRDLDLGFWLHKHAYVCVHTKWLLCFSEAYRNGICPWQLPLTLFALTLAVSQPLYPLIHVRTSHSSSPRFQLVLLMNGTSSLSWLTDIGSNLETVWIIRSW